jgi:hypothetical protein
VSGVAAPLAGAVEPRVLGERHEGGRGQALRGAGDYPLNHTAIFLFAPPGATNNARHARRPLGAPHRRGPSWPRAAPRPPGAQATKIWPAIGRGARVQKPLGIRTRVTEAGLLGGSRLSTDLEERGILRWPRIWRGCCVLMAWRGAQLVVCCRLQIRPTKVS